VVVDVAAPADKFDEVLPKAQKVLDTVVWESVFCATMPNGQKYEEWLKSKGSGEDGKNGGP